MFHRIIDKE